jgi:hypothetical protein
MPIRFSCEHCGVRLSVTSRKAGAKAKCPKCQQSIRIPVPRKSEPRAKDAASEAPPDESREGADYEDPFAQFVVYDKQSELVYETDEEEIASRATAGPVDANKLAVSRAVLYMQGVLLGIVALASFFLGVMAGVGTSDRRSDDGGLPQPCFLRGGVGIQDEAGQVSPDTGAVVVVVPRDIHPDRKAEMAGLLPQDPSPGETHPGLQEIRSIGGDYGRADGEGRFQLRVPDTGDYFLLVISANVKRREGEQPKAVLAQIGRFFQLDPELFDGYAYRWQEEAIRRDRELSIVFP